MVFVIGRVLWFAFLLSYAEQVVETVKSTDLVEEGEEKRFLALSARAQTPYSRWEPFRKVGALYHRRYSTQGHRYKKDPKALTLYFEHQILRHWCDCWAAPAVCPIVDSVAVDPRVGLHPPAQKALRYT